MTTKKHNKILAAIFFVLGILQLYTWIAIGGWELGEWLLLIYAIFFMVTGFMMHNEKKGAKICGIITSLLFLPAFPIGTAIGIYGLWFFVLGQNND